MQTGHTFKADRTAQIIQLVISGELTPTRAAQKLGISRRHVYRLRDRMLESPNGATASRRKGRPGSGLPPEFRARVIDLVRSHYADFGPTMAAEKLAERHGINVSREWLRQAMIRAGIWQDRLARMPRIHQLRTPCECRGELVQVDGSHHRWFEDRGPKCALLVFIDDATSEILHLEFAPSESSFAYMQAMLRYVQRHGRPVAIYSDKHTVFRKAAPNPERNSEPTQFGRSLERLQIGMINAETAQAKGRVERANRTLQDRLIKEMRLAGISCIADANAFVQSYIDSHNTKFARQPASPIEAHRPLPCNINLQDVFRFETGCTLSKSLHVNYDKRIFILDPSRDARALVGKVVTLCEYPDGRVTIEYKGQRLLISKSFDKLTRIQPPIVNGKQLHQAIDEIRQEQASAGDADGPLPFQTAVEEHIASAMQVALSLNIEPHHRKRNGDGPSRLEGGKKFFPEYETGRKEPRYVQVVDRTVFPRKLSKQLTFQHRMIGYMIEESQENRKLIGCFLDLQENELCEVISVSFEGRALKFGLRSDRAAKVPHMRGVIKQQPSSKTRHHRFDDA